MKSHTNPSSDRGNCDPRGGQACDVKTGPVREAGGTTGAGNLSPGQASRTGGATSGDAPEQAPKPAEQKNIEPSP